MISSFFFLVVIIVASCTKSYNCTCVDNRTKDAVSNSVVSGKNANDAASACIIQESDTTDCILVNPNR